MFDWTWACGTAEDKRNKKVVEIQRGWYIWPITAHAQRHASCPCFSSARQPLLHCTCTQRSEPPHKVFKAQQQQQQHQQQHQ
eukprot:scaffold32177_cov90-Skeletonema_marinoi.AAC.6